MGCACFTVSKGSVILNNRLNEKKINNRRNILYAINNWNIVLDFLQYRELNSTARVCRYNNISLKIENLTLSQEHLKF